MGGALRIVAGVVLSGMTALAEEAAAPKAAHDGSMHTLIVFGVLGALGYLFYSVSGPGKRS